MNNNYLNSTQVDTSFYKNKSITPPFISALTRLFDFGNTKPLTTDNKILISSDKQRRQNNRQNYYTARPENRVWEESINPGYNLLVYAGPPKTLFLPEKSK